MNLTHNMVSLDLYARHIRKKGAIKDLVLFRPDCNSYHPTKNKSLKQILVPYQNV